MGESRWPVASCDADFSPYLAGMPEASVAMFGRFIDLARAAGRRRSSFRTARSCCAGLGAFSRPSASRTPGWPGMST
jgi:hypothetical protein